METVVGRGTLLAGRYRMLQPTPSDLRGSTSWDATDQILDRPVRVTVLAEGDVPQALDAARRAALVTDARLVRVLDVGEHETVAYVVTEQVTGPSLAQLVARNGPLPADQARAVVGEAAAALEAARRRGVHHLALRPSVLHLTPDDRVRLTGLAVDAALLGQHTGDARATTRADTVGLVALLYAALTGRWPEGVAGLGGGGGGAGGAGGGGGTATAGDGAHAVDLLPAAPVLEGGPVAPAELVSGIPNDLDTLCAVTLGAHDDGPHSPAELVRELEPWGAIRAVDLLAASPSGGARDGRTAALTAAGAATQVAAEPTGPGTGARAEAGAEAAEGGGAEAGAVTGAGSATPGVVQRQSVRSVFSSQPAADPRPGTPPPAIPPRQSAFGAGTGVGTGVGTDVGTAAAVAATAAAGAAPGSRGTEPQVQRGETSVSETTPRVPTARTQPAGPPARAAAPPPPPAQETSPFRPDEARPTGASPAGRGSGGSGSGGPGSGGPGSGGPGSQGRGFDELVAAREAITTKRFDPTRLVLAVVVVALLVGFFLAFRALTSPPDGSPAPAADPNPNASAPAEQPADEPTEDEVPAQEPEPSPDPGAAPLIASGQQLDPPPDGDENEHPEAVALAIDGDPGTVWYTRTYKNADFGGLKEGVGYAVTLTQPAVVNQVTLQVRGTGGRVELRATDPATPTAGPVLAEAELGPDTVLALPEPTETQQLVLWFTALPTADDGGNRIELAEVTVS